MGTLCPKLVLEASIEKLNGQRRQTTFICGSGLCAATDRQAAAGKVRVEDAWPNLPISDSRHPSDASGNHAPHSRGMLKNLLTATTLPTDANRAKYTVKVRPPAMLGG